MKKNLFATLKSLASAAQLAAEYLPRHPGMTGTSFMQAVRTLELATLAMTRGRVAVRMLEASPWKIRNQLAGLGVTFDDVIWQDHASQTWLEGSHTYERWASDLAAGYRLDNYSGRQNARAASGFAFFEAQRCVAECDSGRLRDAPFIGGAMVGAVTDQNLATNPKGRGGVANIAYRMVAKDGEVNVLHEVNLCFTPGYLGRMGEDIVASLIFLNGFLEMAGLSQVVLPDNYGVTSEQLFKVHGGYMVQPSVYQQRLNTDDLAIFQSTGSLVIHRDGRVTGLTDLKLAGKSYFGTSARPAQFAHGLICREYAQRKGWTGEVVIELTMNNADPSKKEEVGLTELLARASQFAGIATVILRRQGGLFLERAREYRELQNERGNSDPTVFIVGADTMLRVVDPQFCERFGGVAAVLAEFKALGVIFRVMPRDETSGKSKSAGNMITRDTILENISLDAKDLYSSIVIDFEMIPTQYSSTAVRASAQRRLSLVS